MADARRAGSEDEAALWHKRLFYYLDWLFQRDSSAGAEFAALQARSPAFCLLRAPLPNGPSLVLGSDASV